MFFSDYIAALIVSFYICIEFSFKLASTVMKTKCVLCLMLGLDLCTALRQPIQYE